ncbi:hypothetical protein V6X63_10275 [Spiribacter sp. 221]|uniref:hypothetical protein n=1 Tax=Spiribacter onubensis TaxID=3122420 RepID=UPI00349F6074
MSRRGGGLRNGLIALGVLVCGLGPAAASSLPSGSKTAEVIVDGQRYELTAYKGTYTEFDSHFGASTQPWWGNQSVAADLAENVFKNQGNLADGIAGTSEAMFVWKFESNKAFAETYLTGRRSYELETGFDEAYVDAVAVPEIDGAGLAQGALALGAIGLWMIGRDRTRNGAMPDTRSV